MTTVVTMAPATSPAAPAPAPAGLARWTPTLPTNLMSLLNPFAAANSNDGESNAAAAHDNDDQSASRSAKKRPVLQPLNDSVGGTASRQSSFAPSNGGMFDEPDTRSTSEECSLDGKERLRRSARPKTQYSICHAPPASSKRQKLHRRPRALLQLHKLSAYARPRPAFEVIPSANFSVRLTRAIAKVFTARHSLCPNDLVVMQAENYGAEESDEEEELRDIIGLICKGRKDDDRTAGGKARIYLASGREWEASTTLNGAYEFVASDEHGLRLTVRWVPKKNKDGSKGPGKDGCRKFNFSTISPTSRRHPVIATLSKTTLDINDTYRMPDPAAATPLSTPQHHASALGEAMEEEGEQGLCETDDQLREIISVTSIWVAFREGWSPTFRYDDKDGLLTPASPTKSFPVGTPPVSPAPFSMEKRRSFQSMRSGIMRRTSMMSNKRTSTTSNPSVDDDDTASERQQPMSPQSPTAPTTGYPANSAGTASRKGRARADSSSTVLVHRAASNRSRNSKQQRKSLSDLLASHNQLQEVAREELATRDGGTSGAPLPAPSSDDDDDDDDDEAESGNLHRTSGTGSKQEKKQRGDSAATDASGHLAPPSQKPRRLRKSGSWRRLLCGAGLQKSV